MLVFILSFAVQGDAIVIYTLSTGLPLQLESVHGEGKAASEFFFKNTGSRLACSLLDTFLDFGSCSRYRMVEPQTVRVANHTSGKMTCLWVLPGEHTEYALFY